MQGHAFQHGEESLLTGTLVFCKVNVLGKRSRHVVKDADQLLSGKGLVKQFAHPLLLSTLLVLLGHDLVNTCQNGPSDSSNRIWDALACPTLQFATNFSTVFEDFEHIKPLGAS